MEMPVLLNVPLVRDPSPPILLLLNGTDNVFMFVLLALKNDPPEVTLSTYNALFSNSSPFEISNTFPLITLCYQ